MKGTSFSVNSLLISRKSACFELMSERWQNNVRFERADVWAQVVKIYPCDTHAHSRTLFLYSCWMCIWLLWMHTEQLHLWPSLKHGTNQSINWQNFCTPFSLCLTYTHTHTEKIQITIFHQSEFEKLSVRRPFSQLLGSILSFSPCFSTNSLSSCQYYTSMMLKWKTILYRPGERQMETEGTRCNSTYRSQFLIMHWQLFESGCGTLLELKRAFSVYQNTHYILL